MLVEKLFDWNEGGQGVLRLLATLVPRRHVTTACLIPDSY
jgi:hypothetical protein